MVSESGPTAEAEFKAAVEAHAVRTGGVMVGDVIAVGDRAVRVTGCEGGRLEFEWSPAGV